MCANDQVPPPRKPIVLATANPHKISELMEILSPVGLPVLDLSSLPGGPPPEPAETGRTFAENAAIKARAYARETGHLCLADDSGLEVDALGGRPGVISSHYATDGRETGLSRAERDRANNLRLLRELEGVPPPRRTARFVCCMCLALPDGRILATSRGTFEGWIGVPPRVPSGDNGFGYDPLFMVGPPEEGRGVTSAELIPAEKNARSHRAVAARRIAACLQQLIREF
jgi:XTP/dITP diphosphohydrolase